jgi:ESF2/ABP1 family protein
MDRGNEIRDGGHSAAPNRRKKRKRFVIDKSAEAGTCEEDVHKDVQKENNADGNEGKKRRKKIHSNTSPCTSSSHDLQQQSNSIIIDDDDDILFNSEEIPMFTDCSGTIDQQKSEQKHNTSHHQKPEFNDEGIAIQKRGIILLTSVPAHMNLGQVRSIMNRYGQVTNMYLKAKSFRTKKRMVTTYSRGWVEFSKRSDARNVVELLNGTSAQGSVRHMYRGELWNIRYLKGVTWERLQDENVSKREGMKAKLRTEREEIERRHSIYRSNVMAARKVQAEWLKNTKDVPGAAGDNGKKEMRLIEVALPPQREANKNIKRMHIGEY